MNKDMNIEDEEYEDMNIDMKYIDLNRKLAFLQKLQLLTNR